MPVLERPEIKKEDLGDLANIFLEDLPAIAISGTPITHFYVDPERVLCVEAPDYSGLVVASPDAVKKYVDSKSFVALYESTSDNGTHRVAVYQKQRE
jgi:hypothetical protein